MLKLDQFNAIYNVKRSRWSEIGTWDFASKVTSVPRQRFYIHYLISYMPVSVSPPLASMSTEHIRSCFAEYIKVLCHISLITLSGLKSGTRKVVTGHCIHNLEELTKPNSREWLSPYQDVNLVQISATHGGLPCLAGYPPLIHQS